MIPSKEGLEFMKKQKESWYRSALKNHHYKRAMQLLKEIKDINKELYLLRVHQGLERRWETPESRRFDEKRRSNSYDY